MKRVLIIGSGKRVREAALPALHRVTASFGVRGMFARTAKKVEVEGRSYDVEPLAALDARRLADSDLVYLAVGKDAVPKVLAHLTALDVSRVDLLIDTPVVRFKHFRHTALLARFRNAWVAEDCAYLPWFDTVRAACAPGGQGAPGPLGPLRSASFIQSVYAYHGLATAKALFGADGIVSGRRRRYRDGTVRRELVLAGGAEVAIDEPRDYSKGIILVRGERGATIDREIYLDHRPRASDPRAPKPLLMRALADGLECRGFRIGDVETHLDAAEIELARGDPPEASITARTQALKRVGFLRLLRAIDAGRGAYPIAAGIDDMVVDYYLEKLGRWRRMSLTDPRSSLGSGLLRMASRIGGG